MNDLKQHLEKIQTQIRETALSCQRTPESITLLAVSKKQPIARIQACFAAGQLHFGESYLQEALPKINALQAPEFNALQWHFIGVIQSNKTRQIATHFDWVQSVDRLKIAHCLAQARSCQCTPLNICLQVNISGEEQKSGFTPDSVFSAALAVNKMPSLCLRGVMAIAEKTENQSRISEQFRQAQKIYQQLQAHFPQVDTLSLGMSQDYPLAIAAGSTMVRLGSILFS